MEKNQLCEIKKKGKVKNFFDTRKFVGKVKKIKSKRQEVKKILKN